MLSDRHYQRKEMRVLSREEQQRFIAYLLTDMDTCKFGVRLTLFTGMRIGELCALQWGNISLREKTIRITVSTHPSGHTYVHIFKIYATDGKRYTHRFSSRSDAKKVQQWFNADPPLSP